MCCAVCDCHHPACMWSSGHLGPGVSVKDWDTLNGRVCIYASWRGMNGRISIDVSNEIHTEGLSSKGLSKGLWGTDDGHVCEAQS